MTTRIEQSREVVKTAVKWSVFWVIVACCFNGILWLAWHHYTTGQIANQKASEFFAGYLVEKILSIDNLFTFYLIFNQLHIPFAHQRKILFIGIWSAIILRLLLILSGVWLITRFHWVIYLMGAILLMVGMKALLAHRRTEGLHSRLFHYLTTYFRMAADSSLPHFFIKREGLLYVTPSFIALILVEISDIIFAFDSIPAIFAITRDPFIIWTSNIFALLGLRSLYLVLNRIIKQFYLLQYGVAIILIFIGSKMVLEPWVTIPLSVSLVVIIGVLAGLGCWSWVFGQD